MYTSEYENKFLAHENPYEFTYPEIAERYGKEYAKRFFSFFYKGVCNKKTALAPGIHALRSVDSHSDSSSTKHLFSLADGTCIETVCIRRRTGITACLSTQVGCAMRCAFCASGRHGLLRNLSPAEIVLQLMSVRMPINRIVFMGIGEPLHNYNALIKSIHILREREGLHFPTGGMTISTVGPIKQLYRLREEHMKVQLTLSLHSTDQKIRDALIPGMRGQRIEEVVAAALSCAQRHNRTLSIAYLVIPGVTDRFRDATRLADMFRKGNVVINLMRMNPVSWSPYRIASDLEMNRFKNTLYSYGLVTTIRHSHGTKISAACGQLAWKKYHAKSVPKDRYGTCYGN